MSTPRTILPPSSTALERVIDTTFPRGWSALVDAVEPVAVAGSMAALPWIAQHWQLGRIDRYFKNPRDLLAEGLPWLRERGTAAGVKRALGWMGYGGVVIDEDGARLHINPGREVSNAEIAEMAYAVRISIPLHVTFYRVFYRYDLRMLHWDKVPKWDAAIWDNVSGTAVDVGDGVTVIGSQMRITTSMVQAAATQAIRAAVTNHNVSKVRRPDVMRWDAWRWGDAIHRILASAIQSTHAAVATKYEPLGQPMSAEGEGFSSACDVRRGADVFAAQLAIHASECSHRTTNGKRWKGRWDGSTWRARNIQSKSYETTE